LGILGDITMAFYKISVGFNREINNEQLVIKSTVESLVRLQGLHMPKVN